MVDMRGLCASLRRPCAKHFGAAKLLKRLALLPLRRFLSIFKDPV
jgi:hypothetical protein